MAKIYGELHQNIQDKCNEVDIEILSPHYRAVRDGNQTTIPANYLPTDYQAPSFRVSRTDDPAQEYNKDETTMLLLHSIWLKHQHLMLGLLTIESIEPLLPSKLKIDRLSTNFPIIDRYNEKAELLFRS